MRSRQVRSSFVNSRSINLTIDQDNFWRAMIEEAKKIDPQSVKALERKGMETWEKHIKSQFVNTPAVAMPRRNLIYLHGKIPENFIEMVITHETLHIVIQRTCGYAKFRRPSYDKWIDNPAFNNILCYQFNMKPSKFHSWLFTKLGQTFWARLFWRIMFLLFGRKKFKEQEAKSKKVWF